MLNFKVLGVALIGALALSIAAAPAALAKTAIVVGGPGVLGHDNPVGVTELTGSWSAKCNVSTSPGTVEESTIYLSMEFGGCVFGAPTTVTANGCKFNLSLGTLAGHQAQASVDFVCPNEKQLEIHLYQSKSHAVSNCTFEIPPHSPFGALTVTDLTNGYLRVVGSLSGIKNYAAPGGAPDPKENCVPWTLQLPNTTLHVDMTLTPTESEALELVS